MKLRWLLLGLLVTLLLVPAGVLTAARGLDLPGGTWVRLVAFTPYAAALYLVALLLLLIAWARGRGLWRGTARLLAVVALLGVALHAYWASGPFVGTPQAEATDGTARLRVMTVNLRLGEADPARVVEVAVGRGVGVLVLQEVTPQALTALERAGITPAYPHRVGRPRAGAGGTMVFSQARATGVARVATHADGYRLDLRLPGGRLHLLAVHPRPPTGDVSGWLADQQAVGRAARGDHGPTMIVGDLNATMDHQPLRELVGRGYQDAATQSTAGWQPTWPSAGEVSRLGIEVPPLVALDHVLLRDGLRAVRTTTVEIGGTDHRALLATVARGA